MANIDDPIILINPLSNHIGLRVRKPDESITDVLLLRTALLLRLATHIYNDKIAELRAKSGKIKVRKRSLPAASQFSEYVETLI